MDDRRPRDVDDDEDDARRIEVSKAEAETESRGGVDGGDEADEEGAESSSSSSIASGSKASLWATEWVLGRSCGDSSTTTCASSKCSRRACRSCSSSPQQA